MRKYVNIVTSDRGWILERLATALADRLPYVTYGSEPDSSALINYYMTYSCWQKKVSPVEIGFFTHLEKDARANRLFFDTAARLDYCICMSQPYEDALRARGIRDVVCISPGVDLEKFAPRLQIGVVGRTYHTGRKGESLVASLMDIDWIDWHFTGEGWPGQALNLADSEMPAFYRKLDYVLVPAFYEGGPMSVVEALACGTRVIAPPVGWVSEFPHIEYRTGDAADLRRVLTGLYEDKKMLAESVQDITWDAWAKGHDWVFRMHAHDSQTPGANIKTKKHDIVLALHGDENINKGGPSARVPMLADLLLKRENYDPFIWLPHRIWPAAAELAHVFNLWKPASCMTCVMSAYRNRQPVILSPIFLDLGKTGFCRKIVDIFRSARADADLERRLREAVDAERNKTGSDIRAREIFAGQFDQIRAILAKVDHVIFLSEHERRLFEQLDLPVRESTIVHNPVQSELYAAASPELFTTAYGVENYVLCVGRLEPRKNQLLLAYALKDLDYPLVFIGHGLDSDYRALIEKYAPARTTFIDRLDPNSEMLASAYAGAAVYCLPSWAEGASLSALEAAASGCNMVLSDASSEKEYFGDFARYCDPFDPEGLRQAVVDAYEHPLDQARKNVQKDFIASNYSWSRHLEETVKVYESVLSKRGAKEEKKGATPVMYVDLTTSAHHQGPPMGMARVEQFYGRNILEHYPGEVRFTLWNKPAKKFIPIEIWQFLDESYKDLASAQTPFAEPDESRAEENFFEQGASLLIMGGTWTFTNAYTKCLYDLVREHRLNLSAFIHDLVPVKFSCWYPEQDRANFIRNTETLINIASRLFADSRSTKKDIKDFCAERIISCPPIDVVRFGDNILDDRTLDDPVLDDVREVAGGEPFVLFVSDLNIRKNHAMMLAIWRNLVARHGEAKVPRLICVGKQGLQSDIFIALADREQSLKNRLHIKNGIGDGTLDWLYKNCLFTVYPSQYEGWGLPVAESLAHGKVTIASNASSIPEIAPEYTDLIDPNDFKAWESRIESYILNPELRKARERQVRQYQPVSWDDSTRSFLCMLQNQAPNPVEYPVCPLNRIIPVTENSGYLGQGWQACETGGVESAGERAVILARLWVKHDSAILKIRCYARLPENERILEVPVWVNGEAATNLKLTESMSGQRIAITGINREASGFADVRIAFELPAYANADDDDQDKRNGPAIIMTSFSFEPVSLPDNIYADALAFLESALGLDRNNLLYFLYRRSDLREILADDRKTGALRLFLWAWRYGRFEEAILKRSKKFMREEIRRMFASPHSRNAIPGYNEIAHNIWLSRPDLHIWDTSTLDGQAKLLSWFANYGVKEYDLSEFLPELLASIKGATPPPERETNPGSKNQPGEIRSGK